MKKYVALGLLSLLVGCGDVAEGIQDGIEMEKTRDSKEMGKLKMIEESKSICEDGFKRAIDMPDLIYQIFNHIDKKCFYRQDSQRLSRTLGIHVLNEAEYKDRGYKAYSEQIDKIMHGICNKPLDGVILQLKPDDENSNFDSASLTLTDCYLKKHGGFDADTGWIKALPPMDDKYPVWSHCELDLDDMEQYRLIFKACHEYTWMSKNQQSAMSLYPMLPRTADEITIKYKNKKVVLNKFAIEN